VGALFRGLAAAAWLRANCSATTRLKGVLSSMNHGTSAESAPPGETFGLLPGLHSQLRGRTVLRLAATFLRMLERRGEPDGLSMVLPIQVMHLRKFEAGLRAAGGLSHPLRAGQHSACAEDRLPTCQEAVKESKTSRHAANRRKEELPFFLCAFRAFVRQPRDERLGFFSRLFHRFPVGGPPPPLSYSLVGAAELLPGWGAATD
jgi:hypothetical protein